MQLQGKYRRACVAAVVAASAAGAFALAAGATARAVSGHGVISPAMSGADGVQVNPPEPPRAGGHPTTHDSPTAPVTPAGPPVAGLDVTVVDGQFHSAPRMAAPNPLGAAPATTTLHIVLSNHGTDPLTGISVSTAASGSGIVSGLSCDFWSVGGPTGVTSWQGPLPAGSTVMCSATASGISGAFADLSRARATGLRTGTAVDAEGYYHATAQRPRAGSHA